MASASCYLTAARTCAGERARVGQHLSRVQRQHLAVAHQHPSVHDRRPHVVAARDVDEVRQRIVHRRLPRGRHRDDDAGRRACPARASRSRVSMPERARAVDRRHLERDRRGNRAGIAGGQLVQERRLAHRLEHVEVVVAGGAVGAEADGNAGRAHRRRPARRRSPASCCSRDCATTPTCRRARICDVGRRQLDAVRRQRPRPPEAERLEVRRPAWRDTSRPTSSTSSFVSARWMMTGTCSRSASARHAFSVVGVERVHRSAARRPA